MVPATLLIDEIDKTNSSISTTWPKELVNFIETDTSAKHWPHLDPSAQGKVTIGEHHIYRVAPVE